MQTTSTTRALEFPTANLITNGFASVVIGQTIFTSPATGNTATTLRGPYGAAFNSAGDLFVPDYTNNRVLEYEPAYTPPSTPSTPSASNSVADAGQYETFSTSFSNGQSPYTYNWILSNAVTGVVVNIISFSNALTTNTAPAGPRLFRLELPPQGECHGI